jgi:cytochrome c
MKKIILTVVILLILIFAGFMAYIYSGAYDISQLVPHNKITRWIIGTTTHYSVKKRLKDIQVPLFNDTSMVAEGFIHYNEMCVMCHGAPGIDPNDMVEGLYPKPPKFYKSDDMPDPDEAFWIIKNGIKMTSMPAFGPTHNDKKIWSITDFLLNKMNKMSPEEYQEWIKRYSD